MLNKKNLLGDYQSFTNYIDAFPETHQRCDSLDNCEFPAVIVLEGSAVCVKHATILYETAMAKLKARDDFDANEKEGMTARLKLATMQLDEAISGDKKKADD